MHEIRFRDPAGSVRVGRLVGDTIKFGSQEYSRSEIDVLPPAQPTKIVCVGRNYADHAAERDESVPDRPLLFLKPPNAVAAPNATVRLPAGKNRIDWEAELGVVIDSQCRNVTEADAMAVVRGYTCCNDISNRDDQDREQNWVRGKAFDNAAPLGPVVATPDEVSEDAAIELRVNGETKQAATIDQQHFSVSELIAEITSYMTLQPGDVIATGTPAGVGALVDGDDVEVEIEGVGTLEHSVVIPNEE